MLYCMRFVMKTQRDHLARALILVGIVQPAFRRYGIVRELEV